MIKTSEIQIRDPFILPIAEEGIYYLYGTTDKNCWSGKGEGFNVYKSKDLEDWEGPFPAFRPETDFWGNMNFWAPEVHKYKGSYYMLASFKNENACRGTQILKADNPLGPFKIHSKEPVTPRDWECLDGTFFVDNDGVPWMVFCHEWLQCFDGEMCAIPLSDDLTKAVGEPILLFRASEAPWAHASSTLKDSNGDVRNCYVTDGPFLYKSKDGDLIMLWSSHGEEGYAITTAKSLNGKLTGKWLQSEEPVYKKDGGHGMLFSAFDGRLFLTIHTPNDTPNERPIFISAQYNNGLNLSI